LAAFGKLDLDEGQDASTQRGDYSSERRNGVRPTIPTKANGEDLIFAILFSLHAREGFRSYLL
jgi:hypothetical protein